MTKRKAASVDTDIVTENAANMTVELQKLADAGRAFVAQDTNLIMSRWEIGKLVATATGSERKYGESAVRQLAIDWYGNPKYEALLHRCRVLANTYDKKKLQELIKRQGKVARLTWTHIDSLCQVSGNAKAIARREKLENRIIDEGMSVDDLRREIIRLQGGPKSKGGRGPAVPRSPMAALQQLTNDVQKVMDRDETYESYLFDPLATAEDEDLTADLLGQLQTAHSTIEESIETLTGYKSKVDDLIERTAKVVAVPDEDAEAEDDEDAEAAEEPEDDDEEAEEEEAEEAEVESEDEEAEETGKKQRSKKRGGKSRSKKRKVAA